MHAAEAVCILEKKLRINNRKLQDYPNYYGMFGRVLCTKRRFNIYQTKM